MWFGVRETHRENRAGENGEREDKEKLRNLSNSTGQRRGRKKREKELFSGCDKISVTWSVCRRQWKRKFS